MSISGLSALTSQLDDLTSRPPIERWHPEFSGDIDIVIKANGSWFHEGGEIKRLSLVKLFASILRREKDGCYYLITPVEKWRITVESHPLMAVSYDCDTDSELPTLVFTLNTESTCRLTADTPLLLELSDQGDQLPYLQLDRGLTAAVNRNCYYRLIERAENDGVRAYLCSAGQRFDLGAIA